MAIEFRLLDSAGNETKPLPDVESFSLSPILCGAGAIEFTYPTEGVNFADLAGKDEFALAIYIDGVRQPRLDALIKDIDGDDIADDSVWQFSGFFNNGRLAEAVVYPKGWPTVDPTDTKPSFTTATAGTITATFMQQAQSRGTLAGITYNSFSSTTDSNGVAWTKTISLEYTPQTDYLTVLSNLYDLGMAEFEMIGKDLRMYVPGTLSVDRTTGTTPLVFRRGRDMADSPRKVSSRELGTVLLAAGSEGLYVERKNDAKIASRRRIESGVSQGNVSDSGTLTAYADVELARLADPKMEKTQGLIFTDPGSPRPLKDFNVGDWAFSDNGGGLERLRIKQWVLKLEASGELTGSVVLNDLFAERDELLARRVEGITGGSTIAGGSTASDVVPGALVDNLAPSTPTGLTLNSAAYTDNQGHTFAQVSATWVQVTTNADGTILEDLDGYWVRWRYSDETDTQFRQVNAPGNVTFSSWSPVQPGRVVVASIRAYDRAGNSSAWSVNQTITAASDSTPPEVPSAPVVDNYLGLIRSTWNGKGASGAAVSADFSHVEVHVSTTSGFTPSATTLKDRLPGAGASFFEGTYGVTYYVKLVAFDWSRNASAASAQGSATPAQVVGADILDGAVGTAKLANLAVTNAKIGLLAVNDANIGSLDVGKLVAGTLNAQVLLAGLIRTAASGARVEFSATGIFQFDASGNPTVSIPNSGDATFKGNIIGADITGGTIVGTDFATATSGTRVEIGMNSYGQITNPSARDQQEVRMFPPIGAGVITEPPRVSAINQDSGTLGSKMILTLKSGYSTVGADSGVEASMSLASGYATATASFRTPTISLTAAGGAIALSTAAVTVGSGGTGSTTTVSSYKMTMPADVSLNANAGTTPMPTTANAANLYYSGATGSAQIFRSTSSRRYKKNIQNLDTATIAEKLKKLRPVKFQEKKSEDDRWHMGLIAEEVHEAGLTELVSYLDFNDGNGPVPDAIQYERLPVLLLPVLLELLELTKGPKK